MSDIRVRAAAREDHAAIVDFLRAAALPTADLVAGAGVTFWLARDAHALLGTIGLEPHGRAALLRSLAVAPAARGRGIGRRLVRVLERRARGAGIERLLLLTETAAGYFERLGYAAIDRAGAPPALRASAEFRALCPASATCMERHLTRRSGHARRSAAHA
jgi:N-acetylglutamate synthase-like GNAT family acetyltransferase